MHKNVRSAVPKFHNETLSIFVICRHKISRLKKNSRGNVFASYERHVRASWRCCVVPDGVYDNVLCEARSNSVTENATK